MLTDLQRKKLTRYFRVYDIDDDGHVGPADFERVVENVRILHGLAPDSAGHRALREGYVRRWTALRASADADRDGGVDLDEWLDYWQEMLQTEERYRSEVWAIAGRLFDLFDTDEDGELGPDEFCDFYSVYGMETALARRIFVDLDANGDGVISRSEMKDIGDQFYRGDDPDAPGNLLFGPYD